MLDDLPKGFHKSEQDWLYNIPDNSFDYDDWCDGREEIKYLLSNYTDIIQELCEPSNAREARESLDKLISEIDKLKELVERLEKLEDQFTENYWDD